MRFSFFRVVARLEGLAAGAARPYFGESFVWSVPSGPLMNFWPGCDTPSFQSGDGSYGTPL
jgi:hypothetical protein